MSCLPPQAGKTRRTFLRSPCCSARFKGRLESLPHSFIRNQRLGPPAPVSCSLVSPPQRDYDTALCTVQGRDRTSAPGIFWPVTKCWAITDLLLSSLPLCEHSRTLISFVVSRTDCVIELDGPVIKKEHVGHYYTPTPPTACEYSGKRTYASGAHLFNHPRPQQPMERQLTQADIDPMRRSPSGDESPLYLARASPADGHVTESASYLTVMSSRSTAQGFHLAASHHTNTNGRRHPGASTDAAENRGRFERETNQNRLLNYAAPRKPEPSPHLQREPEIPSIVRHQQSDLSTVHDQTSATYEALRHSSSGSYQPSIAAFSPYHQNPHFYPYSPAMSLSYETRTFHDYPQSAMMHDPHQEQDDNSIQHQRYPSPPPPLSENPYNPQTLDAATALVMDEMQELPQKEESDAPSPGRSKPIPKPDREVTKGEDGRFVCSWAGCTEEIRSFNRKCEWSKVGASLPSVSTHVS